VAKELTVSADLTKDTVRLVIVERSRWGHVTKRTQHTFRRRAFERALREAGITVPWHRVDQ
jgi:hypothetical protein